MRKIAIFIALAILLLFYAAPAYANGIPALPHAFYGTVTINGSPAPSGTQVSATVDSGSVITNVQNPVATVGDSYGIDSPYLLVQGDITPGATITFHVNGVSTGQTAIFEAGGGPTPQNLDLVSDITAQKVETVAAGVTNQEVDFSDVADTTITVNTFPGLGDVTITVQKYASNPHPGVAPPANMLAIFIDISVDNPDAIVWPMLVEYTYTDAEIAGLDESILVMYYYKAAAWHECSDTGVNTADNYIWANMLRGELGGSPVAFGEAVEPEPEPEPAPPPGGGGGGGGLPPSPPAPPPGTIDLSGFINVYGIFTASVIAESEDGLCYLTIEVGTKGLTIGKSPLSRITIVEVEEPTTLPEDAYIIGLAYDLGPDGATFSPAISLTINYDPASLPEGYTELDLYIAYWDGSNWLALTTTVDAEANTAYCQVSHFTTFAIIAVPPPPAPAAFSISELSILPAEVEPNEAVTISVSVANTGDIEGSYTVVLMINGVTEAEESVTIAAGASQSVSFSVTKEDAGSYSVTIDDLSGTFVVTEVTPPPTPINWWLIGGIIAAVIIIGLIIWRVVASRKA